MGDFWGERRPPGGVWGGEVGDQGIVVVVGGLVVVDE